MEEAMQTNSAQDDALMQLIKDLGIDTLSQDKQNDIIIKMTEVLLKRVFLETMEHLDEEGREAYSNLTESEDVTPEQVEQFFKEKISNYDEMIQKIIVDFKEEMMETNV